MLYALDEQLPLYNIGLLVNSSSTFKKGLVMPNFLLLWIAINISVNRFTGRVFNGSGKAIDKGPPVLAEDFLDIMGK